MNFFRNHIIFRFFSFLLAAHILNCSIDTEDRKPNNVPEDLSFNDMESIVEIVLEKILCIENAVAEYDEPGDENNIGFSAKKLIDTFIPYFSANLSLSADFCILFKHSNYKESYSEQFHPELILPPPEA